MRFASALLSIALLGACSVEKDADEPDTAEDIAPLDDSDSGTPVRITSKDGTSVAVDSRGGNEAQWPEGFAPYRDSVVTSDIAMGSGTDAARMIEFETADAAEDVVDFYREQARAAGYDIQLDLTVNEGRMITGEREDGSGFSVSTRRAGDLNRVSLTVGRAR